jgi:hypothetical protein
MKSLPTHISARHTLHLILPTAVFWICCLGLGLQSASAKEPQLAQHSATLGQHLGRTSILIDGKPIPGIAYLGPVRADDDKSPSSLKECVNAGIRIVLVGGNGNWQGQGRWDFTPYLESLERVAKLNPDLWLVARLDMAAPPWWLQANPNECARHADSDGPEPMASMGSTKWIKESSEYLTEWVRAIEASPYGKRVIGYSLMNAHGGEWVYAGAGSGRLGDYSQPATDYYRAWLKRKYGDQPWIAAAQIPCERDRKRSQPSLLRDPELDARVIDFDLCFSEMGADNLLDWCAAVKRQTGGRRLVGAFYGYLLWQTGLVNAAATNGHLALRRLLDSPEIDFLTSFPSYDVREPGAAAPFLLPIESIQAAGKLVFNELDNRTHLSGEAPPLRFYMQRDQRDPAHGAQLWSGMWNIWAVENKQIAVDVLRRDYAQSLIRGTAWWWFDMTGGWYSCPEILQDFQQEQKISLQALDWDLSSNSQVAGFVSAVSPAYHSLTRMFDVDPQPPLVDLNADMSTREMYKAGTPIDWWMTEDLARPELQRYRALYFHNATVLDERQLKGLNALKSDGRALIFVGYPGLVAGGKLDATAASRTCGIRLKLSATRAAARFQVNDSNLPCMREAVGQVVFGSGAIVSPRLIIDDPDALVIANWPDGQPAAAMKQHDGWTSYYFPIPPNNAWLFRAIFRDAKCHIYTENMCRDIVYANQSLLAIHSTHYGQPINLPGPAKVTDLFTGKVIVKNGDRINLGQAWQWITGTRLFRVEYTPAEGSPVRKKQ